MDRLSLTIAPVVRTFIVTDVAVGAYLVVDLERYDREDGVEFAATGFGGGAVLAYRIGLGTNAFLLPELGFGAVYYDRTVEAPRGVVSGGPGLSYPVFQLVELQRRTAPWISTTALQASLSLPFAVVLASRFYAGLGPYVRVHHASRTATPRGDDWDIALGLSTLFGTWL